MSVDVENTETVAGLLETPPPASKTIENTAANRAPGHDSSVVTGVPKSVPKTILVVGLGMVGIGERGFQRR